MESKVVTKEQQEKLKKLQIQNMKKSALMGVKMAALIILADFVVTVINALFIQNKGFVFVASFASAFMILNSFRMPIEKEHDRVKEETKKILEN